MYTHSSLCDWTTKSKKEEVGKEKEKEVHKGEALKDIPEPVLTEEQKKKSSLEYQSDQRELTASQKRRGDDKKDAKPSHKRGRSGRRRRSPRSKESRAWKSSMHTGYVSIESSSSSSSEESNHKKAARSAIPLLW